MQMLWNFKTIPGYIYLLADPLGFFNGWWGLQDLTYEGHKTDWPPIGEDCGSLVSELQVPVGRIV